jgi:hypothetical protein
MKKKPIIITLSIWLIITITFGLVMIIDTKKQIQKDNAFIEDNIKPAIKFTENFVEENNRFPDKEEIGQSQLYFYLHTSGDSYENRNYPELIKGIIVPEKGYIVEVWRGDWSELYTSWNRKYYTNNYGYDSSVKLFLLSVIIGILPLSIFLLILRLRKKV